MRAGPIEAAYVIIIILIIKKRHFWYPYPISSIINYFLRYGGIIGDEAEF